MRRAENVPSPSVSYEPFVTFISNSHLPLCRLPWGPLCGPVITDNCDEMSQEKRSVQPLGISACEALDYPLSHQSWQDLGLQHSIIPRGSSFILSRANGHLQSCQGSQPTTYWERFVYLPDIWIEFRPLLQFVVSVTTQTKWQLLLLLLLL